MTQSGDSPKYVNLLSANILLKTCFASVLNMYVIFVLVEKNETYIHLEQSFYILTKTWMYGCSVFDTEAARGD